MKRILKKHNENKKRNRNIGGFGRHESACIYSGNLRASPHRSALSMKSTELFKKD